jgi:hypothetical protein
MLRDRLRMAAAVLTLGLGVAAPVVGQTPTPAPRPSDPFFDDTVLQEVRLAINSQDWQSLRDHYLDNTYYPCDFRWRDQVVRNIGIRSRGSGSRSGIKPGLRVDFNRYVTDGQFLGLKSFVLRNNTQDASSMNERLSMLLFRRMGLPAPREAHTTLYINNEYVGLYMIVESIDKDFLNETFNENDGYLYNFQYPPADAPPYYFEDRGSDPETYVPTLFKPETHTTDPRPEFIVQLVQAINQTSDAAFRTVMAGYLDLQQFLRHLAVEHFVADNDGLVSDWGGVNNFYFYQFQDTTLFKVIAWDKSEAFKNGPQYSIFRNMTDGPYANMNRLVTRALAYADLYNAYLDALLDCANSASATTDSPTDPPAPAGTPGWLEREIQREYDQIADAARADPQKPFTNDDFENTVENLRTFARQRADFVRQEVAKARAAQQ